MKGLFRRLLKFAAYTAATIVILLAIAVGLFRLFLPRLPEYQDEIKAWASSAIGQRVEFAGMDARWGLKGPELRFYDAELFRPTSDARAVAAGEVGIGVSLTRLLLDRTFVVDSVTVRDTSVELQELADGSWLVQGQAVSELVPDRPAGSEFGTIELIGLDIELRVLRRDAEQALLFDVPRVVVERDPERSAVDLAVNLPDGLGESVRVFATQLVATDTRQEPWNISIESDDLRLAGWSALYRDEARQIASGSGAVDLSIALLGTRVQSVSAVLDVSGVVLNDGPLFDLSGRVAFNSDDSGWLAAADDLRLNTARGTWPLTSLRLETSTDEEGQVVMFDARASYLNLADVDVLTPWLGADHQALIAERQPDGAIRNLVATVSDLDSDAVNFAVTAELERAGWAAFGQVPGVRGFTGSVRADPEGGLVSIDAQNLELDLASWMTRPVDADVASGTIIWRRSNTRTTILSDNIEFRNAVLDSQNSIEIILEADSSPVVDFSSSWSINDIAVAKRYIPERLMTPKLYAWFQNAFVAGRIPSGTTRLTGPLASFPFDNGEGRLLIEARAEDVSLKYLPTFPVSVASEIDIVLDNTHLYTRRNRATSLGNTSVNSIVEIKDLRVPVLEIKALSTGTLATIQDFAEESPVGAIFGGNLERVTVDGDATLDLDLTVPIRNWRDFEFTAKIQSSNGSMSIAGLGAPFTELSGTVTVEKNNISSEALGGRFLGGDIAIELTNASDDTPQYRIVANATGTADADALINELGLPLTGRLAGATAYRAQLLFPRGGQETPAPLSVRVESSLAGLSVALPAPFDKPSETLRQLQGELLFIPGGEHIESRGRIDDELRWDIGFVKLNDAWDFDRGVLSLGGADPVEPDVRGLHIQGQTPLVRVEDWLALSRGDGAQLGAGERIRSVDIVVGDLYFLGQHLIDHRVQVDRSARDWLVQLDGEYLAGSAFVPYDFSAASTLVLDMEHLILPGEKSGSDAASGVPRQLDPRTLPAISLRTNEFGLGDRRFGAVEAEFVHSRAGLVAESIVANDDTFNIQAAARWEFDPLDSYGSRSYVTATLTSTDVVATMARLGYEPGIISDELHMTFDMNWSGGPRADFLDTLDGAVQVRLGSGQLDEVEPGAGRMFGLMSIVALPRRLSLDFRDVFQKGFGFDRISGSFNLDDGTAYTCDLSLEGPAADIGIIGQADLVAGSYAQTAVVSPNVGSTLPVVGAIAAGPQVAAAMFLFSQIFKKPLKDIGQVYYSMSGPWDSPVIESADAEAFAESGRLANCLSTEE